MRGPCVGALGEVKRGGGERRAGFGWGGGEVMGSQDVRGP